MLIVVSIRSYGDRRAGSPTWVAWPVCVALHHVCELTHHTAQRAPPWAFTLHYGCSHHTHVSAHALSSPRGIGILAPAPRCDQRAGGQGGK